MRLPGTKRYVYTVTTRVKQARKLWYVIGSLSHRLWIHLLNAPENHFLIPFHLSPSSLSRLPLFPPSSHLPLCPSRSLLSNKGIWGDCKRLQRIGADKCTLTRSDKMCNAFSGPFVTMIGLFTNYSFTTNLRLQYCFFSCIRLPLPIYEYDTSPTVNEKTPIIPKRHTTITAAARSQHGSNSAIHRVDG